MNDLIRPRLYQAHHEVENAVPCDAPPMACDVVGPMCESSDVLAYERHAIRARGRCARLALGGAYGFVMASNYNTRNRAAEVLIRNVRRAWCGKRESFEDLIAHERI